MHVIDQATDIVDRSLREYAMPEIEDEPRIAFGLGAYLVDLSA
jgi:hypothetical protein